jgi:hypothetical protein
MDHAVRWNIKVSKEIDLTLRTYLRAQGMKKGDLSKFIEDAVPWRISNRTVQESNRGTPMPTRTSSRLSLTVPSARPAPNDARKEKLRRPDARGARYQYPAVSHHRSGWEPCGNL